MFDLQIIRFRVSTLTEHSNRFRASLEADLVKGLGRIV